MAHTAHAIAHDNAHGSIEDQLATLLAAMPAGLAALILNTLRKRDRDIGCALGRPDEAHGKILLMLIVIL